MLNEAVYRSPKWLRKFMDFEISTGDDISDKAEKKEAEKKRLAEKKEAEKKRLAAWDKVWRETDEDEFKEFFNEKYKDYVRMELNGWILSSDLSKIKNSFRGDMSLWTEFDNWKREKENKKREQKRIKEELDELYIRLISDFSNNPYNDKINTPTENGVICFDYTFENGDKFKICNNTIEYKNYTFTVGVIYRNKFISLCNEMTSKARTRPGGRKYQDSQKSKRTYDDPNRDRYEKLKDNIKLREEQLKKMSKYDPERPALENELDNYRRALKRIKDKYQFEHIVNYFNFK
jgi:hypothetical protein